MRENDRRDDCRRGKESARAVERFSRGERKSLSMRDGNGNKNNNNNKDLSKLIFLILILKLHFDGEEAEEILNLGDRRISRKKEEEEEKRKEPPKSAFPFVWALREEISREVSPPRELL